MKYNNSYIIIISLITAVFFAPGLSKAAVMSDYTAYPPFVTSAVAPNILLVLDESGSMQFPAYTGCDFNGYSSGRAQCGSNSVMDPEYSYDPANVYTGYFKYELYYQYSGGKFVENATCSFAADEPEWKIGNASGCISGNLLNWATMSRIDILRKALIGGKSIAYAGGNHTLRAEGGWRQYTDNNLGCVFDLSGGTYPDLDHTLTVTNYGSTGTCGYLTVKSNGSSIWSSSDKFRYVYQSINGDFDTKLRIVTPPFETGQTYAKAGLMVRASTNSDSQHVMAMATNGAGLQFARRSSNGGSTSLLGSYVSINYPVWVRIERIGDTFNLYYSPDEDPAAGPNGWTLHDSTTVALPSNALIGMASASYSSWTLGTSEFDEFICNSCTDDDFNDSIVNPAWTGLDINTSAAGSEIESCDGGCAIGTLSNANIQLDVPGSERQGVIQQVSDKDGDGIFDPNSPRFGLMVYASDSRYGCIRTGIVGSTLSNLIDDIQNEPPYYGTPTGEALYEALDYFTQSNSYSGCDNSAFIGGIGSSEDPWCDSGNPVICRKSFVLLISDGEWNGSVDPVVPARVSHVNDIRSMDGTQSLEFFSVYIFGNSAAGINSMQQIGMYGGFDDYDSNLWPYNRTGYPSDSRNATLPAAPCDPASTDGNCDEWDTDSDGLPDNYYEASDGEEIEAALIDAIADILKQASSGTAVSVLATTGEGEGAVYQAYFFPEKLDGLEPRKWLGFVQALFVDKYGNLREETPDDPKGDYVLNLFHDKIIEMEYSPELGTTVNKYADDDGNGVKDSDTPLATVPLENINPIWRGGKELWQTIYSSRTVFSTINGYDAKDFTTVNATIFQPYLRAAGTTESENLIKWTLGDDLTGVTDADHADGFRVRSLTLDGTTNVWKLGDIIHSTPTVLGRPVENYDLLYGDSSYSEFRYTHRKRRQVVYVGANDGMLHAFNGGCFDEDDDKYYPDVDASGDCIISSRTLGEELWAFIPRGLLPHLAWNTSPDYTHVYHVDAKPKITDVNIFTPDSVGHTNGWGTILIGGFRYGGKDISWTSGGANYSASPEYFALDITDPLNPRLLWTFSDPDLGLSMAYPAVAKIGSEWFAIFGSGATNYDVNSNLTAFQNGNIFVLKLSAGANGVIDTWTQNTNYWKIPTGNATAFMSDSVSVDVDIDFDVDVMYIGENYLGASWNAQLHRITTNSGSESDPSLWILSTLGDINSIAGANDPVKRITAAPSVAMDDRANLWTFFGSGQFLGSNDKNQTDTGAFYAIKDGCWDGSCTDSYTNLMDISTATVKTDGTVSGISGCGNTSDNWSALLNASTTCDGWAMYFSTVGETVDFTGTALNHTGERTLTKPLVLGGLVTWATYIPGIDECSVGGESNVYAVYFQTGTAYKDYVFKEQKEDATPSDEVARVVKLGEGLPSSLSAQVTADGTAKGFAQQSTGTILEIESITPISLQSDVAGWKNEAIP